MADNNDKPRAVPAPPLRDAIEEMQALVRVLEASIASGTQPAAPLAPRDVSGVAQADELMDWIKADLSARSLGAPAFTHIALDAMPQAPGIPPPPAFEADPGIDWPGAGEDVIEIRDRYAVGELLRFHDAAFLRNAFRAILHREPDPQGYEHYRWQLEAGRITRLDVLLALRDSDEGQRVRTVVQGLRRVRFSRGLRRVPVLGGLLALMHAILRLPSMAMRLDRLETDLMRSDWTARQRSEALRAGIQRVEQRNGAAREWQAGALDAVRETLSQLRAHAERMHESQRTLRTWAGFFGEGLLRAQGDLARHEARLSLGATREELLRAARTGLAAMHEFARLRGRLESQLGTLELVEAGTKQALVQVAGMESAHRAFEADYRAITDHLARELRERFGTVAANAALDAFYYEFENRFRGEREDIRNRVGVYLPDVRGAYEATGGAPVLDIGCGRGEWLEVMRDAGIGARGVDSNEDMIRRNAQAGLDVVRDDALHYLRTLPDASLAAVTAFHVVEHLQFPDLVALFAQARRVLKPGGLALFETPNPENLNVGAHTFWYDPTHVRPLPPAMLEFLAQSQGFEHVEVRRLHPNEPWEALPAGSDEELRAKLNALLYGPRDYAVLARKA